eukprot:TRINITY_DN2968_c0_g1_i2.p1 TRINITY_DN2968_c0_g1~~TRINITY_DN2968_c0_g1_i2.p1  ORF type:complete len:320 (-),score=84.17 TRINITY_DN2968_c0_g1_i2:471-1400(-)
MVNLKIIYLVAISIVLSTTSFVAAKKNVVYLTSADFDEQMAKGDWLLEFFVPNDELSPEVYEDLASRISSGATYGRVDVSSSPDLGERFNIRQFPTAKFVKRNYMYDFTHPDLTLGSLLEFAIAGYTQAPALLLPPPLSKKPQEVTVLTDDSFDEATKEGTWLLDFYAPWCGHCKKLNPIFDTVGAKFMKMKGIHAGKIDCTVEKGLAERFNIRGYPTLKVIKDGKLYDYSGGRTEDALIAFAKEPTTEPKHIPHYAASSNPTKQTAQSTTSTDTQTVLELQDSNFEEVTNTGAWLVMFYAPCVDIVKC